MYRHLDEARASDRVLDDTEATLGLRWRQDVTRLGLKQGLKVTLLFGVSKLGWLKMLKNWASYRKVNRSGSLVSFTTEKSSRDWNGPLKILRPPCSVGSIYYTANDFITNPIVPLARATPLSLRSKPRFRL